MLHCQRPKNLTLEMYGTCQKKVAKHVNTSRRLARSVLAKRLRYSHTNVHKVHEMRTTMVAVRMCIGVYTVRELHDNTVTMGLRFCLHKVVAKNRDQFATFFDKYRKLTCEKRLFPMMLVVPAS